MADNTDYSDVVPSAMQAPPQAPLVSNFDTMWEAIRLLGMKMSGQPYRHPGTLNIDGDLWESLGGHLITELSGGPLSQAKSADAHTFANNQAMIINKVLASLPGGAGNDPRTRATVQRIAEYAGKYGTVVLQALKTNLGEDDQDSPLGSIIGAMESAFDAFYGPTGSQASAVSLLGSSMRTAVPLLDRSDRLEMYRHERYAPQNRKLLHGASAREDAAYMALMASHNVSPLNVPNENAMNIFNDVLSIGNAGLNEANLMAIAESHVYNNTRGLLSSGTMQQAISTFAKNNAGGNIGVERALNSYANQIDIRSNLEGALHTSGIEGLDSVQLLNNNNLADIQTKISNAQRVARAKDPNSEETVALDNLRKQFDFYYDSQTNYRKLGGGLSDSQIAQGIENQRMLNIQAAAGAYGNTITQDLQKAIALRNDIQRRSPDIGSIEDLAKDNHWAELIAGGTINQQTSNLLQQYFGSTGGAPSLHAQYTNLTNNLNNVEFNRLNSLLTGYQNAPDKQAFWREHEDELRPLVNASIGLMATNQNFTAAFKDLETAFSATNSTIGGRPFSGIQDTGTFANMLFQGEWGRVPASTYNQSIPAIASGMIRTGTNADQTLQYAGLAADKADQVGGDRVTSSLWGAEAALTAKLYQKEHGIADQHLASRVANVIGLAPSMLEGQMLNALTANLNENNIQKIKDPRHRAIAEKILRRETLSNDEIAILGREGETMFQDMGFTPGKTDAALSADYSNEAFAKQNAFNVGQYALSKNRRENVDAGTDVASNYLAGVLGEGVVEDEMVARSVYNVAMSSTKYLSFDNKKEAKDELIKELKRNKVNSAIIKQIDDNLSGEDIITLNKNIAQNFAANNGYKSPIEAVNAANMGEHLVKTYKEADIVAQAWHRAPKREGSGFSAALAEINHNANATIEDVIAAAITYKLDPDEQKVLAENAAIASVYDNNLSMSSKVSGADQRTTQDVLLKLTDAYASAGVKDPSSAAADLAKKMAVGEDELSPEEQKILKKAGLDNSKTFVTTAGSSLLNTEIEIIDRINQNLTDSDSDPKIKAKVAEQTVQIEKNKAVEQNGGKSDTAVESSKSPKGTFDDPIWIQEKREGVPEGAAHD